MASPVRATAVETRCEVRWYPRVQLVDVSAAPRYSPHCCGHMLETVGGADGLSRRTRERCGRGPGKALFAAENGASPRRRARLTGSTSMKLGTADTLVDVVGVVHGLEQLGVERVCASPLVLGEPGGPRRPGGYSNPAPATLEIIAAAGAPVAPERQFNTPKRESATSPS